MDNKPPTMAELCKSLGSEYQIREIDYERCIYCDFGNGFDVEISGVKSCRKGKKLTLYLWYCESPSVCINIKTVRDVERSAESISDVVNGFKLYAEDLIQHGYDNRDAIFHIMHPELKKEDKI